MQFHRLINNSGARLGALVDASVFALMLGAWYAGSSVRPGIRSADTGAMGLWAPLLLLLTLVFCAMLSAASSVLGAVAGYWAQRTGSPVVGALVGLSSSVLVAAALAVLFPGSEGHFGSAWLDKIKWLLPPAVVAGVVVGFRKG